MSQQVIKFYFDFISPNAYLAWTQLPKLQERYGVSIEPVPVLFAALLDANDQKGPAEVPAKRDWMSRNVARKASILNILLSQPKHHPFNPLLILRLASIDLGQEKRWELINTLMDAIWVKGIHGSDSQQIESYLSAMRLDASSLIRKANSASVKEKLTVQTNVAIKRGVFGVPSFELEGEVFFGYDDINHIEMVLAGEDPLITEQAQKWLSARPTPSAIRKP